MLVFLHSRKFLANINQQSGGFVEVFIYGRVGIFEFQNALLKIGFRHIFYGAPARFGLPGVG